jgi:predicted metal-dependent hydrolase
MAATRSKVKVRNVSFDFNEVPKHWILRSSIATHFVNSMHVVFPEGEKFFVRSVRRFANDIQDPQLKKDIHSFCGQEGIHAREHQRFWDVMEAQGLNPSWFANFLKKTAFSSDYSIESLIVKGLNRISPRLGDKMALSVTTALEHYTAILANALFHEPIATNDNIAPQMLELLHWHAAEEIEHKAVCFDVLKQVDNNYILRVSGMGIATLMLWGYIGFGQIYFIAQDKDKAIVTMPAEAYLLFKTIVFGEVGRGFARHLLDYFKKDFHPNDIDDRHLIEGFFSNKTYA